MGSEEKKTQEETPLGWFKPIYLLIPLIGLPVIGLAILTYFPFYPDITPEAFNPQSPPEFSGALQRNDELNKAKLQYETLPGLESTVIIKGDLYASLSSGPIVRLKGDSIQTIVDCNEKATTKERKCGHPLGLRADEENNILYVADCIKGLYKLDLTTRKSEILYPAFTFVDGKPSVLIDDLIVTKEGDIFFTDASTKWGFNQMHLDFTESSPNGRILHYDPQTKSTRLLLDKLYFPNGIELEPGEESFLFAESSRYRILRYYLRGPNRGGVEIFADNLPGIPDNIRASGRGTYWVPLVIPRLKNYQSYLELFSSYPWFRQIGVRTPYLITLPFQVLDQMFQTNASLPMTEGLDSLLVKYIGGLGLYGLVVELDSNGNIIRSLHSQDAKVHSISQATEHEGTLYLGSPWENGIWLLPLDNVVDR